MHIVVSPVVVNKSNDSAFKTALTKIDAYKVACAIYMPLPLILTEISGSNSAIESIKYTNADVCLVVIANDI